MTGLHMMLQSFGIKIDPKEIETAFDKAKNALPELAQSFNRMDARLARIEQALNLPPLEDNQNAPALVDATKKTSTV